MRAGSADRERLVGRRVLTLLQGLAVLLCACGVFPGDTGTGSAESSASPTESGTPSPAPAAAAGAVPTDGSTPASVGPQAAATTGAPAAPTGAGAPQPEAGTAASATDEQVATIPQGPSLEDQLARLAEGQEALALRLDSMATRLAPAEDAQGGTPASGEVIEEAGQRVRSFGVGVAWSALVIVLFSLAIRGFVWVLDALAERNARRRLFYKRLVPIVRIVLWVFAAYLIVSVIFRVDTQGLFAAAAAVGVAVGFAAQDLLKNLFGGLILVFDQPFQVGDKISVGGTYGEVKSLGLRSTRIVTADDNLVSVPNAQVVDQQVANANAGELNSQVVTDLYLPGWADEALAKRIAFDAAATSKYVYLNKPIVVLVADVFKETFLTRIRVKAYVLDPRLEFLFQSEVTERARAGFREAGLLRPENMRLGLVRRSAAGLRSDGESTVPSADEGSA